jgi:hypothetical protein
LTSFGLFPKDFFKVLNRALFKQISNQILNNFKAQNLLKTNIRMSQSKALGPTDLDQSVADQLASVQLDQDGKPLSKNALKKLEKEREKAKKKVSLE